MNSIPLSASLIYALEMGAEEIIGKEGKSEVCRAAQLTDTQNLDMAAAAKLRQSLNQVFGVPAASGLMLRIGRAACQAALREFGASNGLTALDFRLLPSRVRLRSGLQKLAEMFQSSPDLTITSGENEQGWWWSVAHCPECAASSREMDCMFWVGLLQEYFAWCSAGKIYRVIETECAAAGSDHCVFQIYRQPLE